MSINLDIRTLLTVLCIVMALSSLALTLLYRLHPSLPGPRDWAIGMVSISAGIGLLPLRDVIPPVWSIAVANVLILGGHVFLVAGVQRFIGRPPAWPVMVPVAVLCDVPITLFHAVPEALELRVVAVSVGLATLSFLGARAVGRASALGMNAHQVVAGLFALHGAVNLVRGGEALLQSLPSTGLLHAGNSQGAVFAWSIMFSFGMTAGFSVMVTERLRDALQARINDLDAARRAAEDALREQRNFLTMVSHEFRTPLGIMAASADLIACNLPPSDHESAEELDRIRRASRRLGNLVEGCLADDWLATVSENRRSEVLDVGAVLADLASEYDVTLRGPPEAIRVDADPYLLPVAFSALLDNARKYTRTPGGVTLSYRRVGKTVEVAVGDDGPGIDPAETSRLFEKFYRARRTQHKPGAGLGLYLVRRILDLHDGRIRLDQTRGTLFRVTLPALDA